MLLFINLKISFFKYFFIYIERECQRYLLTITCFGIAIGALWEVVESRVGIVLSTEVIESLNDTIIDVIMDSLGSVIAALRGLGTL
jgi:hypothetical protein